MRSDEVEIFRQRIADLRKRLTRFYSVPIPEAGEIVADIAELSLDIAVLHLGQKNEN